MAWEIVVPQTEEPKKLENFLKNRFHIGYVRKLFRKSGVRINGQRSGPEQVTRPGDRIQLYIPFEKYKHETKKIDRASSFEIIFEDHNLLVLNKPAGLAVHEGKGILKRDSLIGMLETSYRAQGVVPKLVHRIDRETSGLLVAGKDKRIADELEKLFEKGDVEKEYMALVVGHLHPKKGTIDFPLPGREGQPVSAITHYSVEKQFSETTLVRVRIETGRMHQVRLHFARLGHPVVMDDEHGDFTFNKRFRKGSGLKRQFLHAAMIAFDYRGKKQRWTAPLADDLARTLRSLASQRDT
jgi:23S rRNA pseudouridine955/2504/2580 synthase